MLNLLFTQQKRKKRNHNPAASLFWGFATYVLVGVIFISLPFAQKTHVSLIDNIFNVVSALSTTGLTTGALADLYTTFGDIVLLCLIQLGAIGYMTLTSFFILSRSDKISTMRVKILSAEFTLPEDFNIKTFIKNIIIFTFSIETIGSILLYTQFKSLGLETPLWSAIFHTVSAFATAGFSLYPDSFIQFNNNAVICLTIATLCYLGAIGFIVPMDIYRKLTGQSKEITLTSKIIVLLTGIICIVATSIYVLTTDTTLLNAFFQVASASTTAGFNSVNLATLPKAVLFVLIFIMIIGASPSGTGGGIKTTSLSALLGVISSVKDGHPENITFMKKRIPSNRVMTAVATATSYVFLLSLSTLLVCIFDDHKFLELCFETVSALGTVGLSLGITPDLSPVAKIILACTMFLGRLGPLTLGIAFFRQQESSAIVRNKTDLAV